MTFLLLLTIGQVQTEADHVRRLAPKYAAQVEVVLWDRTRCDLVSDTHAIEVDYAAKWAEAIGQSLYYSIVLKRKPAVVLLVRGGDERYVYRCQTVCAQRQITLHVEPIQ